MYTGHRSRTATAATWPSSMGAASSRAKHDDHPPRQAVPPSPAARLASLPSFVRGSSCIACLPNPNRRSPPRSATASAPHRKTRAPAPSRLHRQRRDSARPPQGGAAAGARRSSPSCTAGRSRRGGAPSGVVDAEVDVSERAHRDDRSRRARSCLIVMSMVPSPQVQHLRSFTLCVPIDVFLSQYAATVLLYFGYG
ncbi:hypothetical protein BDA96_03G265100 [Sorghum bicolor]|uniref:Uncharacterized protein n=2 Tax=Sorghum bicolor TaxID=4558 RepID=A0A921REI2_SORBI|nr:hypothetical protein BDA96_03G265100 [Sorghum bicolor]OQU87269.1 hypothetical protein SORBI_3003G244800 [Sorghum bicolor]